MAAGASASDLQAALAAANAALTLAGRQTLDAVVAHSPLPVERVAPTECSPSATRSNSSQPSPLPSTERPDGNTVWSGVTMPDVAHAQSRWTPSRPPSVSYAARARAFAAVSASATRPAPRSRTARARERRTSFPSAGLLNGVDLRSIRDLPTNIVENMENRPWRRHADNNSGTRNESSGGARGSGAEVVATQRHTLPPTIDIDVSAPTNDVPAEAAEPQAFHAPSTTLASTARTRAKVTGALLSDATSAVSTHNRGSLPLPFATDPTESPVQRESPVPHVATRRTGQNLTMREAAPVILPNSAAGRVGSSSASGASRFADVIASSSRTAHDDVAHSPRRLPAVNPSAAELISTAARNTATSPPVVAPTSSTSLLHRRITVMCGQRVARVEPEELASLVAAAQIPVGIIEAAAVRDAGGNVNTYIDSRENGAAISRGGSAFASHPRPSSTGGVEYDASPGQRALYLPLAVYTRLLKDAIEGAKTARSHDDKLTSSATSSSMVHRDGIFGSLQRTAAQVSAAPHVTGTHRAVAPNHAPHNTYDDASEAARARDTGVSHSSMAQWPAALSPTTLMSHQSGPERNDTLPAASMASQESETFDRATLAAPIPLGGLTLTVNHGALTATIGGRAGFADTPPRAADADAARPATAHCAEHSLADDAPQESTAALAELAPGLLNDSLPPLPRLRTVPLQPVGEDFSLETDAGSSVALHPTMRSVRTTPPSLAASRASTAAAMHSGIRRIPLLPPSPLAASGRHASAPRAANSARSAIADGDDGAQPGSAALSSCDSLNGASRAHSRRSSLGDAQHHEASPAHSAHSVHASHQLPPRFRLAGTARDGEHQHQRRVTSWRSPADVDDTGIQAGMLVNSKIQVHALAAATSARALPASSAQQSSTSSMVTSVPHVIATDVSQVVLRSRDRYSNSVSGGPVVTGSPEPVSEGTPREFIRDLFGEIGLHEDGKSHALDTREGAAAEITNATGKSRIFQASSLAVARSIAAVQLRARGFKVARARLESSIGRGDVNVLRESPPARRSPRS